MFASKGRPLTKAGLLLVAFVVFGILSFGGSRFYVHSSQAYEVAIAWLRQSTVLADASGPIQSVRMSWMDDASIDELEINGSPRGEATFTLIVKGMAGSVPVKMKLSRVDRNWKVVSAVASKGSTQLPLCSPSGC